jgi:hypothetical protein
MDMVLSNSAYHIFIRVAPQEFFGISLSAVVLCCLAAREAASGYEIKS